MAIFLPRSLDALEEYEIPKAYDRKRVEQFIERTRDAQGSELANAQTIFRELCVVLDVDPPRLKKPDGDNTYCFEADVVDAGAKRRMDVYRYATFIFEAKQGVDPKKPGAVPLAGSKGAGVRGTDSWRERMMAGRVQVGRYAAAVVKRGDAKAPFLILADLGHRFWVWSSWSTDAADDYGDFEDAAGFAWDELARPEVFNLVRTIFTAPQELNEEARGQRVTAEIAAKICALAGALEGRKLQRDDVGNFLMRSVFTMFAEDVGLLPAQMFSKLLDGWIHDRKAGKKDTFVRGLRALWKRMDGGSDLDTGERIRRFNGYLFKDHEPLDLTLDELTVLREAARADWRKVSPAIFGTLLERALTPAERHRLGAHYTPEPYIRRLVEQTMIIPLREEWALVRAEMQRAQQTAKTPSVGRKKALALGAAFRKRLATLRVLDPACGSGNFLYVALRELKRLEGEVERTLIARAGYQPGLDYEGESVHPVQLFGIEVKPWAAKIAELVLWIGYLQWQTAAGRLGRMEEPLIKDLHHIEARDALISWRSKQRVLDDDGNAVLRAVGVTDKKAAREMVPVERLVGVKVAPWPEADFIVGNPPFLGNKRMNDLLGSGYVDAIKETYPEVNGSADLVMWWWWRAADLASKGEVRRFGFVTTNSITQTFDRAVVSAATESKGVRLVFAIPDHPWYDDGAAVRIAMTVGTKEEARPLFARVLAEVKGATLEDVRLDESEVKVIHPDLSAGANVLSAVPLRANEGICCQGFNPVSKGFELTPDELRACGYSPDALPEVLRPYASGRDLTQRMSERYIIDFQGVDPKDARTRFPLLWNRVAKLVRPQRERQNDRQRKDQWWLFGRSGAELRAALRGLKRYVGTSRTAKHRIFTLLDAHTLPNTEIVVVAVDGGWVFGALCSRAHLVWADRAKGTLEDRPRYFHTTSFRPFPFPDCAADQRAAIARLGEAIDEHRKARQQAHPDLTLTDLYNVLAKLRAKVKLTADDEAARERSLADTLLQLHDALDAAVSDAYGWPAALSDDELLERLVRLNAARAKEEAAGKVRWLRPEFQAPEAHVQTSIEAPAKGAKGPKEKPAAKPRWPKDDPSRFKVVVAALAGLEGAAPLDRIVAAIEGAESDGVENVLRCLAEAQRAAEVEHADGAVWILRA